MKIKTLDTISFETLIDCFLKSFSNYYVQMPQDPAFYKNRWKASNVQYHLSYGMFDEEKLVGFIIHSIGKRNNELVSYNSGTGVLPAYRGQKIVKSIYNYALKELALKGIKKHTLEVITENTFAIKAYESVGFNICKKYLCFGGELNAADNSLVSIKEVNFNYFDWEAMKNQQFYSWDNHYLSLKKADFKYFLVSKNETIQSYFVINTENGYLAQFDLLDSNATLEDLFIGIQKVNSTVRMNNVDDKLASKANFLKKIGLKNTINQYEMELIL
jgi:GNAT superfamily N-acetyltransferase